ncbi:MAG TPA: hypothetical protein VHG92_14980, partial [Afifellaceae bacterium]|nr:hypothetical protein [Afifellaceae bacterium]
RDGVADPALRSRSSLQRRPSGSKRSAVLPSRSCLKAFSRSEHDGPPVKPPTRSGFGTSLLEKAFRHDLDGSTSLRFEPDGLRCRLDLDLKAVTP